MITNITVVMSQSLILHLSFDFVFQTFKNIKHYYKTVNEIYSQLFVLYCNKIEFFKKIDKFYYTEV